MVTQLERGILGRQMQYSGPPSPLMANIIPSALRRNDFLMNHGMCCTDQNMGSEVLEVRMYSEAELSP